MHTKPSTPPDPDGQQACPSRILPSTDDGSHKPHHPFIVRRGGELGDAFGQHSMPHNTSATPNTHTDTLLITDILEVRDFIAKLRTWVDEWEQVLQ